MPSSSRVLIISAFIVAGFSGCGGSSNSTDAPLPPQPGLTLTSDSFTVETARSNLLDVLANDGQNLQLQSVSGGQGISVSIENNQLRYVARCCELLSDTVQYTASDTSGKTASASVVLSIRPIVQQTLIVDGFPPAVLRIEGAGASPTGGLQSFANVRSPFDVSTAVQIAYAVDNRNYEFVSILGSMTEQNQRSGNTGLLTSSNWDALRLSPLSTALAGELRRVNGNQFPATSAQLQAASLRVDWQRVLDRASLIAEVINKPAASVISGRKLIDIALDDALADALRLSTTSDALLAARINYLKSAPTLPTDKLSLVRGGDLLTPLALEFSGSLASSFSVLSAQGRFASVANRTVLALPVGNNQTMSFDRIAKPRERCNLPRAFALFDWVDQLAIAQLELVPIALSKTPAGEVSAFDMSMQGLGVTGFFVGDCNSLLEAIVRRQVMLNTKSRKIAGPGTSLSGEWLLPHSLGSKVYYLVARFNGGDVGTIVYEGPQSGPSSVRISQVDGNYQLRYDLETPMSVQLIAQDGESFSGVAKTTAVSTNTEQLGEVWFAKKQAFGFNDARFSGQRFSQCCAEVGIADIDFAANGEARFVREVLPNESVQIGNGKLIVNTRIEGSFRNAEILTVIATLQDGRVLVSAESAKNNFVDRKTAAAAKLVPIPPP